MGRHGRRRWGVRLRLPVRPAGRSQDRAGSGCVARRCETAAQGRVAGAVADAGAGADAAAWERVGVPAPRQAREGERQRQRAWVAPRMLELELELGQGDERQQRRGRGRGVVRRVGHVGRERTAEDRRTSPGVHASSCQGVGTVAAVVVVGRGGHHVVVRRGRCSTVAAAAVVVARRHVHHGGHPTAVAPPPPVVLLVPPAPRYSTAVGRVGHVPGACSTAVGLGVRHGQVGRTLGAHHGRAGVHTHPAAGRSRVAVAGPTVVGAVRRAHVGIHVRVAVTKT